MWSIWIDLLSPFISSVWTEYFKPLYMSECGVSESTSYVLSSRAFKQNISNRSIWVSVEYLNRPPKFSRLERLNGIFQTALYEWVWSIWIDLRRPLVSSVWTEYFKPLCMSECGVSKSTSYILSSWAFEQYISNLSAWVSVEYLNRPTTPFRLEHLNSIFQTALYEWVWSIWIDLLRPLVSSVWTKYFKPLYMSECEVSESTSYVLSSRAFERNISNHYVWVSVEYLNRPPTSFRLERLNEIFQTALYKQVITQSRRTVNHVKHLFVIFILKKKNNNNKNIFKIWILSQISRTKKNSIVSKH